MIIIIIKRSGFDSALCPYLINLSDTERNIITNRRRCHSTVPLKVGGLECPPFCQWQSTDTRPKTRKISRQPAAGSTLWISLYRARDDGPWLRARSAPSSSVTSRQILRSSLSPRALFNVTMRSVSPCGALLSVYYPQIFLILTSGSYL